MAGDDAKPKKVNGLTKPMTLSAELAAIVGAKKDEKLARSEIIKRLWAYLKKENLQVRFIDILIFECFGDILSIFYGYLKLFLNL